MLGRWLLPIAGPTLPDRALVGGKAWSVAAMRALELPVPPAVVITTRACAEYLREGRLPEDLVAELERGIAWLEAETGRRFGGSEQPLLVSVRSGAPVSMPGMMDTVLNLGMNETAEAALAQASGLLAAVEAGATLVMDLERMVARADKAKIVLMGLSG